MSASKDLITCKRKAKVLKKVKDISYCKALDEVAKELGYKSYKEILSSIE